MKNQQNIAILGSTGSIGQSTLAVIKKNSDLFNAYALSGHQNVALMLKQCIEFKPKFVAMADRYAANELKQQLHQHHLDDIAVLSGQEGICELAELDEVDQVMAAIVGSAGLYSTMAAIKKGKRILLANKESLVTCGHLFMSAIKAYNATLLPVDSEHNAIFQSLPSQLQQNIGQDELSKHGINRLLLTGSGGPFRDIDIKDLQHVTPDQALRHPNWSMGKKISIDSATMMNKGLEYIEARWLFNASNDEIEILIHPQSIIHSMVGYTDGSVIAQLGEPDMKTPIAYAMSYPNRINSGVKQIDFTALSQLTFKSPDFNRYPCLKLAIDACKAGQAATTIINAANEIAVEAFLNHQIKFNDIAALIDLTLNDLDTNNPCSIDDVLELDLKAREVVKDKLEKRY